MATSRTNGPEPADASARARAVPQRLADRTRAVVDAAIDRVFDDPYVVETPADFEQMMIEHHGHSGAGTLAGAGAIAAFVRSATPVAERFLRVARTGSTAAARTPFMPAKVAKYAIAAIPVAMSLSGSARRGVHEIRVLGSYLVGQFRAAGVEPDRRLVRALTLSLILAPNRRARLDIGAGRASAGLARQWTFRAIGSDSAEAVRARARGQLAAIARLDLRDLAEQWAQQRH